MVIVNLISISVQIIDSVLQPEIHHLLLSMIVLCINVTIQAERIGHVITRSCF